jgi:hypothetical protein
VPCHFISTACPAMSEVTSAGNAVALINSQIVLLCRRDIAWCGPEPASICSSTILAAPIRALTDREMSIAEAMTMKTRSKFFLERGVRTGHSDTINFICEHMQHLSGELLERQTAAQLERRTAAQLERRTATQLERRPAAQVER